MGVPVGQAAGTETSPTSYIFLSYISCIIVLDASRIFTMLREYSTSAVFWGGGEISSRLDTCHYCVTYCIISDYSFEWWKLVDAVMSVNETNRGHSFRLKHRKSIGMANNISSIDNQLCFCAVPCAVLDVKLLLPGTALEWLLLHFEEVDAVTLLLLQRREQQLKVSLILKTLSLSLSLPYAGQPKRKIKSKSHSPPFLRLDQQATAINWTQFASM